MFKKELIITAQVIVIGIFVFMGISYLINSNYSQVLDSVATGTSLVYNIRRDKFEFDWKGGTFVLNLNGKTTNLYLNPDAVKDDENIFVDSENLVIKDTCNIVQLKIDLELAKINNDLTSIHFDDEYKPMDIVKEIRCI